MLNRNSHYRLFGTLYAFIYLLWGLAQLVIYLIFLASYLVAICVKEMVSYFFIACWDIFAKEALDCCCLPKNCREISFQVSL